MEEPVEGDKPPKRRRGPGKRPPMLCTSLRLPKEVMEYFDQFPNKQTRMREVLTEFVKRQQGNYDE